MSRRRAVIAPQTAAPALASWSSFSVRRRHPGATTSRYHGPVTGHHYLADPAMRRCVCAKAPAMGVRNSCAAFAVKVRSTAIARRSRARSALTAWPIGWNLCRQPCLYDGRQIGFATQGEGFAECRHRPDAVGDEPDDSPDDSRQQHNERHSRASRVCRSVVPSVAWTFHGAHDDRAADRAFRVVASAPPVAKACCEIGREPSRVGKRVDRTRIRP